MPKPEKLPEGHAPDRSKIVAPLYCANSAGLSRTGMKRVASAPKSHVIGQEPIEVISEMAVGDNDGKPIVNDSSMATDSSMPSIDELSVKAGEDSTEKCVITSSPMVPIVTDSSMPSIDESSVKAVEEKAEKPIATDSSMPSTDGSSDLKASDCNIEEPTPEDPLAELPMDVPPSQHSFDRAVFMTSTPKSRGVKLFLNVARDDAINNSSPSLSVIEDDHRKNEAPDIPLDDNDDGKTSDQEEDEAILNRGQSQALFKEDDDLESEEPPTAILDETVDAEDAIMEEIGDVTTQLSRSGSVVERMKSMDVLEEEEHDMQAPPADELDGFARKLSEEDEEWHERNKAEKVFDFEDEEEAENPIVREELRDWKGKKRIRARRAKEDKTIPVMDEHEEARMSQRMLDESVRVRSDPTMNPPPAKRKSKSSRIEAPDQFEIEVRKRKGEVDDLVKNNIKIAAIQLERRAEILLSLSTSKGPRDSIGEANEEIFNDKQLQIAQQRVDEAKEREGNRPCVKREKFNAMEKKYQDSLLAAKQKSLDNVVQNLRFINVNACEFSSTSRKADPLAVLGIQCDILKQKVPIKELVVGAAKVGERFIVVDGVNRIMAFRELSKILHEKHGDEYDSGECPPERGFCSQLGVTASRSRAINAELSRVSATQPATGSKLRNPYSVILAEVVESAPEVLGGPVFGALHKANMKPRGTPVATLDLAIRRRILAKPFQLDSANGRTVAAHLEALKRSSIECSPKEIIFLRTLDEDIEHLLKATLEANPHENLIHHNDFLRKFTHARKVCKHTADRVIRHLADGRMDAKAAIQMIADHSTKIYYVLSGRNCPSDPAQAVQDRLEGGQRTYRTINYHVQNNRRLDHASMLSRKYDPELILIELERLRYPHAVGFVRPNFVELPEVKSDGDFLERCVLNFIDIEDFNANYENTFMKSIGGETEAIYFIVHTDPSDDVIPVGSVSEVVHGGNRPVSITVQHTTFDDSTNTYSKQLHSHSALMVAGSRQNAWRHSQLEKFLTTYQISNILNNEALRRIMYQAKQHTDDTVEINKYNMVYVHSASPVVVDIVANMALNRVATSLRGDTLEKFKRDLVLAQEERTMYGDTIELPPGKLPSNGEQGQQKKRGKRSLPGDRD